MNKSIIMGAAIIAAIAMTSCGTSKESAYRKAYEKAKAQEQQEMVYEQPVQQQVETPVQTPVVTPLVEQPATTTTVVENTDNVAVRQEKLSVVDGDGLKAYSVVVGAYGVKANATGLKQRLVEQGNAAQIAFNSERNVYRVIIGTYDSKADAVAKRNAIRSTYKDAWILYNK